MTQALDYIQARTVAQAVCLHYQVSAPAVSRWADGLYVSLEENPRDVTAADLLTLNTLISDDNVYIGPHDAQNVLYHHLENSGAAKGMIDY